MVVKLLKANDKEEQGFKDKKLKVLKVSGNYDKKAIIDETEDFISHNQLVEKHSDMKLKYEKHCDGWCGFITYEDIDETEILFTSEGKNTDLI